MNQRQSSRSQVANGGNDQEYDEQFLSPASNIDFDDDYDAEDEWMGDDLLMEDSPRGRAQAYNDEQSPSPGPLFDSDDSDDSDDMEHQHHAWLHDEEALDDNEDDEQNGSEDDETEEDEYRALITSTGPQYYYPQLDHRQDDYLDQLEWLGDDASDGRPGKEPEDAGDEVEENTFGSAASDYEEPSLLRRNGPRFSNEVRWDSEDAEEDGNKRQSKKRKLADSSEDYEYVDAEAAAAAAEADAIARLKEKVKQSSTETIFRYLTPTDEEKANPMRGEKDESRFTVTLRRLDGTVKVMDYKRQEGFDWEKKAHINHLKKWCSQIFSRADLALGEPTIRWTAEEADILTRIVRRAVKTAGTARGLNWHKINHKFRAIMKTKMATVGMPYAITSRSRPIQKEAEAVNVDADQASSVPVESNGDNSAAHQDRSKSSDRNERREAKRAKRAVNEAIREARRIAAAQGNWPPADNSKKGKSATKGRSNDSLQNPDGAKKSSGRKPQTLVVLKDYKYLKRKTTAVERMAGYLPEISALKKAKGYKKPKKNNDADQGDSDIEYSCGAEDSESENSGVDSDSDAELEGGFYDDPDNEKDDEEDGPGPASNTLGGTLVSAF